MRKRVSIFVSGNGSNAEVLYKYFQKSEQIDIVSVISNRKEAGIFDRALNWDIPVIYCSNGDFENGHIIQLLEQERIDVIILAGFLKKIPVSLINKYENKIINIHPALLPKFGGKGMYGMNVHCAVKENNESESGITIHLVDKDFDSGKILFQKSCGILPADTPQEIARKVQVLEHQFYPTVIEEYITQKL
ncbi:MAG: phosphoribosylglycinamide formyltransferase [Bacteroidales bacterium]